MEVRKLLRGFLGEKSEMPRLSADETLALSAYVRTGFRPEDWMETTERILEMIAKVERELPFHFVRGGAETKYGIFIPRDSERFHREGYKIGRFLEKFFEGRGYQTYSLAEQKPVDSAEYKKYGTGWGWNVFVYFPRG